MGLLDVLNGMANGPSGRPDPRDAESGGMSKTTMALLAFLAYKAYRNWTGQRPAADPSRHVGRDEAYERDRRYDAPTPDRGGPDGDLDAQRPQSGGGLGDLLRDLLNGGRNRSETMRRGIGNMVEDFDRAGHGDVARSWIAPGQNRELSQGQLEADLGEEGIRELVRQTGMDRAELLETLQQHLPRAIDALTPDGRLPSREEADRNWQ
jgi:uncharacterized protein YidB (DUF937 family)